jgi:Fe-S cluster assembly protein SufD
MSVLTTDKNINQAIANSIRQNVNVDGDSLREDALQAFQTLGLPHARHEEYKYTPITRVLEKNFAFTPAQKNTTILDIKSFLIPGVEGHRIVFINGIFSKEHSQIQSSEFKIQNLADALKAQDPDAINNFGKFIDYKTDALAAWNRAGWTDGMLISVPDNKVVEKPILVYNIIDGNGGEIVSVARNLFVLGKNSQATIIEKFDSTGPANHFTNYANEISLCENAGLNFYSIQNDEGNRYQFNLTHIYQKRSSRLNTFSFTLKGKMLRNNLQLSLDGEGIESHMYGLYLLDGDTLADNHTVVDHKQPNSFSNELYKGVMDGNSRGVFNGKIFVRPNAQKTNAFQANRNILLTDRATVNTKPQLEIWADDVKCSHGCTSGQIDEEALFYLQSRGISKETARAMMLYAFVGEVIDHVSHPVMKEYLDTLVSERLHKNF